jgi:hypothetical protein
VFEDFTGGTVRDRRSKNYIGINNDSHEIRLKTSSSVYNPRFSASGMRVIRISFEIQ